MNSLAENILALFLALFVAPLIFVVVLTIVFWPKKSTPKPPPSSSSSPPLPINSDPY